MKDLKALQEGAEINMAFDKEEWKKFVMAALDFEAV